MGENTQNTIIDGSEVGNVVHIIVDRVNVTGFTARNSSSSGVYAGIYLDPGSNCNTTGNNITDNGLGARARMLCSNYKRER